MADIKKTTAPEKKPAPAVIPAAKATVPAAAAPVASTANKPAQKRSYNRKAPGVKAEKAPAAKAEKVGTDVKAAKTRAKTAKAVTAKKTAAIEAPVKSLEDLTAALWTVLKKAKNTESAAPLAINVVVPEYGTFFIALSGDKKDIIKAYYNDHNGVLEASYEEIQAIIRGKYDFVSALAVGKIHFSGDVNKAIKLKNIFKV